MQGSPQKENQDWGIWAIIVFMFAIGLSPIALLLLFIKLFGKDEEEDEEAQKTVSRTGKSAKKAVRKAMKSPAAKKSTTVWLKIGGGVLALGGLVAFWEPLDFMVLQGIFSSTYMEELVISLAMLAGGVAMFCKGLFMERAMNRYARYLVIMGDRDAIAIQEIARVFGCSARRVRKDLEKMIERGYFGGKAYLHAERGYLFRSSSAEAVWDEPEKKKAAAQETGYTAALQRIRCANDAIDDPVLSGKIRRLEEISLQIFRAVEDDPRKKPKIDTFLNYYLPTTQKLLDSYVQFEAAGVEGENLRQAKQKIEATMDSIIRGFEHQLDSLYQADAWDIDSDIRVMETMLRRDTATVEEDFGMGAAVQKMKD